MSSAVEQRGFAYLLLLGLLAAAGLFAATATVGLARPGTDQVAATEARLERVAAAAAARHRIVGALPSRLDVLDAPAPNRHWSMDPWRPGAALRYGVVGRDLEVRSVGPDGRLRTTDDVVTRIDDELLLHLRQRATLRILRSVYAASRFRRGDGMAPATVAQMVAAMREAAAVQRAWYFAAPQDRNALRDRLTTSREAVDALVAAYGLPIAPTAMRGARGLPRALGLPESRCVDGLGRRLLFDATLGFVAAGGDRAGGTDDDM